MNQKRITALALTLVMMVSLLPSFNLTASADANATVTVTKKISHWALPPWLAEEQTVAYTSVNIPSHIWRTRNPQRELKMWIGYKADQRITPLRLPPENIKTTRCT